jgi:glycosyltransferase involved in cell wall biosynthesis
LVARGFSVRVVTFEFDRNTWSREFQGIEVVTVPKHAWTDVLSWDRYSKIKVRARRTRPALEDADVIVAHNFPCNFMLGTQNLAGRRIWQCNEPPRGLHSQLSNPYLTARVNSTSGTTADFATTFWREKLSRDGNARGGGKRLRLARLDIEATRNLDRIYGISEFSRDNARRIYGKCREEVVYPFVRFPKGGSRSGPIAPNGLEVLVQTRLEVMKNVDSVIRGFAAYLPGDPKAVLHVVGDGPLRCQLENLALELLPPRACQIHGYLSNKDLCAVYDRCDVFALLTIDEPFGMVYPEAAARGLLMIGPDHGGPFEILEGGAIGRCIDPFEPAAFAQALQEIRALSTSEANRQRVAADRSCRARFNEAVIEASLLRSLGETSAAART